MNFKLTILLLASFLTKLSLACSPKVPTEINIHVDLNKGTTQFYTSKTLLDERPYLSMDSCRNTAVSQKFIMFGLGIENLVLTNETTGFNYTPQEETVECKLKNNPFSYQETKGDRYKKLKEKRDFFNRCVEVQVTELNPNVGLIYPEEQPGCKIEKVSKWSVNFTGPYCFFQPVPESNYSVYLDIKSECRNLENISEYKTNMGDYNALLNTYIAGDSSGFTSDLTAISTTNVRFSMGAPETLLPLSEDFGPNNRPRWPVQWTASNLFLGEVKIHSAGDLYDEIKLPIVTDTICKRKCEGNICASPCDYSQPVVGEYSLYELVKGKREFISLWYDGSVVGAQYQGMLYGMGQTLQREILESGKIYEIEVNFREPDLDFAYFSGRVKNELRLQNNNIGSLVRTGEINQIPLINTIGNSEDIPMIPVITSLSFENSNLDGVTRALSTWQTKLDNVFWPPVYETMCSSDGGKCLDSGVGFVTLTTKFTLSDNGKGGFNVESLGGSRKSNIVTNKTFTSDQVIKVTCGDDEDEDDFDFDWGDIL